MVDAQKPKDEPVAPTCAGLPDEERARFPPRHVYEPPQSKSRLRSFRDAYGIYGVWLICAGLEVCFLAFIAYRLDHEHFWFHVCIELGISFLMVVLTVIFVERVLEYRRKQERKERWAIIRNDTFDSLHTVLKLIVRYSVIDLLDESIPSTGIQDTSSAYYKIERELRKKSEALKEAKDAEAVQKWANKIPAWHDRLAPVFNLFRTVTAPHFLHSARNRTLLRMVLGLEALICQQEIDMIDLRRPDSSASLVPLNLEGIALIVSCCAHIRYYLEQARTYGVKDIDDWAEY